MTGCSYGSLTHVALGMFFLIMQVAYFGIVFLTQEKKKQTHYSTISTAWIHFGF